MKSLKKAILTGVLTGMTLCTMTIYSNATTVKVTTETLNVRKGPSTSTEVIAMLSEGVECELLEEEGNWYKVKYKNYTGYVSKDYVKVVGASSSNNSNENNTQNNSQQNNSTDNNQNNNSQQNNNTDNNQNNNSEQNNNTDNNQNNNSQQNSSSQNNQTSNSQENNEQDEVTITYKKFNRNTDIKLLPLIHSSKIGSVKAGAQVIFITEASGWSYIQTDSISGWVRSDTLSEGTVVTGNTNTNTSEKKGYVNESSVNLRKGAGTSNSVVKVLTLNTEVTIIGEEGDWYKVKAGNSTGYILKEYVSDSKKVTSRSSSASRTEDEVENTETTSEKESTSNKTNTTSSTKNVTTTNNQENTNKNATSSTNTTTKTETTSSSKKETNSTTSSNTSANKIKGTDIVAYAQKYLGYKYVYGGDGSNNTFDCSGFTMYVFKHFGIKLSHGANAQYNSGKGKKISKQADLQVGDIVFLTDYETGKGIGHCGIYLGNGNFIHASTTTYSVTISSLNTMYKGRFYAGLRLI